MRRDRGRGVVPPGARSWCHPGHPSVGSPAATLVLPGRDPAFFCAAWVRHLTARTMTLSANGSPELIAALCLPLIGLSMIPLGGKVVWPGDSGGRRNERPRVSRSLGTLRDRVASTACFRIDKGERVVIHGPSGCGKTTVLRLLAGFLAPDNGKVLVGGRVVAADKTVLVDPEHRELGMVFQDLALWPHLTVAHNLEFALKAQRLPAEVRKERISDMLARVKLQDLADAYPARLSGGQQQRVAIARALVSQPLAVLMDEPLASLDDELKDQLGGQLLDLHAQLRVHPLVYVTHSKEECAKSAAGRSGFAKEDRRITQEKVKGGRLRPRASIRSSFLGSGQDLIPSAAELLVSYRVAGATTSMHAITSSTAIQRRARYPGVQLRVFSPDRPAFPTELRLPVQESSLFRG
jgi:iron(III) transport system ATP-binding protein